MQLVFKADQSESSSIKMASDNVMQLIDYRFGQLMHGLHLHTTNICSTVDHKIGQLSNDIRSIQQNTMRNREDIDDIQTDLSCVLQRLDKIESRIEFAESEVRRRNVKFFGVMEKLSADSIPDEERIIRLLNQYTGYTVEWKATDLERVFRVGARAGAGAGAGAEPRPLVVQFHRWHDKIDILNDEVLRSNLRRIGIRISSDLTSRQQEEVQFYRGMGKLAYFKNGKLEVKERQQHPRSVDSQSQSQSHFRFGQSHGTGGWAGRPQNEPGHTGYRNRDSTARLNPKDTEQYTETREAFQHKHLRGSAVGQRSTGAQNPRSGYSHTAEPYTSHFGPHTHTNKGQREHLDPDQTFRKEYYRPDSAQNAKCQLSPRNNRHETDTQREQNSNKSHHRVVPGDYLYSEALARPAPMLDSVPRAHHQHDNRPQPRKVNNNDRQLQAQHQQPPQEKRAVKRSSDRRKCERDLKEAGKVLHESREVGDQLQQQEPKSPEKDTQKDLASTGTRINDAVQSGQKGGQLAGNDKDQNSDEHVGSDREGWQTDTDADNEQDSPSDVTDLESGDAEQSGDGGVEGDAEVREPESKAGSPPKAGVQQVAEEALTVAVAVTAAVATADGEQGPAAHGGSEAASTDRGETAPQGEGVAEGDPGLTESRPECADIMPASGHQRGRAAERGAGEDPRSPVKRVLRSRSRQGSLDPRQRSIMDCLDKTNGKDKEKGGGEGGGSGKALPDQGRK